MRKGKIGKRFLSIILACLMLTSMIPFAAFADEADGSITVQHQGGSSETFDSLSAALNDEDTVNGDTVVFSAGEFDMSGITITKAVNLQGAGSEDTVLKGTVMYNVESTVDSATLTVSDLTIKAGGTTDSNIGLCWSKQAVMSGYTIDVSNCAIDGWQYGVGVNSGAKNCTLNVKDTVFTNTFCAVTVGEDDTSKNEIGSLTNLTVSTGCYAVQSFGYSSNNLTYNGFYETVDNYVEDKTDGGLNNPDWDALKGGSVPSAWEARMTDGEGGYTYGTLKDLVEKVSKGNSATIDVVSDVTLSEPIAVNAGANVTVNGNGHSVSYPVSVSTAFGYIQSDTKLAVKDLTFNITNVTETPATGFGILTAENTNGIGISVDGCTFNNIYSGVYFGHFEGSNTGSLNMTNCTFNNCCYAYSVDNYTNGSATNAVNVEATGNTLNDASESESWENIIVTSEGVDTAYHTWNDAIAAAETGDTITLNMDIDSDIAIDKAVSVNGNGHNVGAVNVTASGVTLNDVNAKTSDEAGSALTVGSQGSSVTGDITINGGSYVTTSDSGQGMGAMRIFASGAVTVKNVTTTGGIQVFNPASYDISDNIVGFAYTGDTAFVGILVFYDSIPENMDADSAASGLMAGNNISIPNTASDYAQIATEGESNWEFPGQIPGSTSVAQIGDTYYQNLQDAVDAVANEGTITLLKDCSEAVSVARPVTFTIDTNDNVTFTGSVSAGNGYRVTVSNGTYTVSAYSTGGSGTGGSGTQVTRYAVSIADTTNGTVTSNRSSAAEGAKVTLTVAPNEGYELGTIVVTDANGDSVQLTNNNDSTYSFTMPDSRVTVSAIFTEAGEEPTPDPTPSMPFTDVNDGDWFYDVVQYAYDNGLMTGTSATTFEPNTSTTRGMIVAVLNRLEGGPTAEAAGFTDVNDGDWYADAVNWAASVGIVNGFEDNTFRANDPITREQMAAILYNYADYKGYDVSERADLSGYADADSISSWALDTLEWANAEGLITGMSADTIAPQGQATRAQVAAMFQRFLTAEK